MKHWLGRQKSKLVQKPLIIGITGSMAMGKSTLVKLLRSQGKYPVFEADKEIKKLYSTSYVCQKLSLLRPELVKDQSVQRNHLVSFILENPAHLQQLEAILYPELAKVRQKFLQKCRYLQMKLVFLDIPLLIEKQMQDLCDKIIIVQCPSWLQQKRLRLRLHQSQQLQAVLAQQQLPTAKKIKYADFAVQSGLSQSHLLQQLQIILRKINSL